MGEQLGVRLVSWVWTPACCGRPVLITQEVRLVTDVTDDGRPCVRPVYPTPEQLRQAFRAHTAQHN